MKKLLLLLILFSCTNNKTTDFIGKQLVLTTYMENMNDSKCPMNDYKVSDSIMVLRFYSSGFVYIRSKLLDTIYTTQYYLNKDVITIVGGKLKGKYCFSVKGNDFDLSKLGYLDSTQNSTYWFKF